MQSIDLPVLISALLTLGLAVTAIFLFVSIGHAVILVMDHGGNVEKRDKAHAALKDAILGFVIVMVTGSVAPSVIHLAFNAIGYVPTGTL